MGSNRGLHRITLFARKITNHKSQITNYKYGGMGVGVSFRSNDGTVDSINAFRYFSNITPNATIVATIEERMTIVLGLILLSSAGGMFSVVAPTSDWRIEKL